MHDAKPYSTALLALQKKCGQSRLLVQSENGASLNSPIIRIGDVEAFMILRFLSMLRWKMLLSLEGPAGSELRWGSHVDRLLSSVGTNVLCVTLTLQ